MSGLLTRRPLKFWKEQETPSLLAIFAHPDDESFTVGGTLARYAAEGVEVSLLCATRGEAGIEGIGSEEVARVREQELQAACAVLGVREVRFLSYHDGELAQADPAEVMVRMMRAMRELRPQVVITFGPDGISGHPDHVAVSRLATAAFDAVASEGFVRRLYYVAPSPATEQGCGVPAGGVGEGVVGIDISPYREAKIRAMQCHRSQHQPFPGETAEEAERLVCHEFFRLARGEGTPETDLFAGLS
ncbi:MAG: PIG-L deacetylase family protein [Anaerolineae bacterium]